MTIPDFKTVRFEVKDCIHLKRFIFRFNKLFLTAVLLLIIFQCQFFTLRVQSKNWKERDLF